MYKKTVTLSIFLIFSLILSLSVFSATTIISGNNFSNGEFNKTMLNINLQLTNNDTEQELSLTDDWFNMSNLVSYYKMNNDMVTDTFALDETGKLNISCPGVCPPMAENGILNNKSKGFSSSTHFNGGDSALIDSITDTMTLNIWVNISTNTLGDKTIISKYAGATTSRKFNLKADDLGEFVWIASQNGAYGDGTVSQIMQSANGLVNLNQFDMITLVFDNAGNTTMYQNGIIIAQEVTTITGLYAGGTADYIIGCRADLCLSNNGPFRGELDEISIFNRTMTQTEIQNLYLRQKGEYINEGSYKSQDIGEAITTLTYSGINNSGTTEVWTDGSFFYFNLTGNSTATPVIYNVTINEAAPATYTSIKNYDLSINNFSFDSPTPVTLVNLFYNTSLTRELYSRASFNTIKTNHPATTNLYMSEVLNGVTQYDKIIRSMSLTSGWGIGTKPITSITTNIGTNNQTIQVYDDAQGGVTISGFELHNTLNYSQAGNDIDMKLFNTSFNFSSTTFEPVYNFTFTKSVSSGTIMDLSHTFTSTGIDTPRCFINNTGASQVYGVYLPSTGIYRSSGIAHKFTQNNTQENLTLWCKTENGQTIINDISIYLIADQDVSGNIISSYEEDLANITLTAGTHQIMNLTGYEVLGDGDEIETIISNVFRSLTGEQLVELYITMDGVDSPHYFRQLSSNDDLATSKMYSKYNHSLGDIINGSISIVVETGEQLVIETTSGLLYEGSRLNTTTGNLPPVVVLDFPENNTNVSGLNQQINFSVNDLNGNLDYCNITLLNSTGSYLDLISGDATSPTLINWSDYPDETEYILKIQCIDTLGLTGQDNATVTNKNGQITDVTITSFPTFVSTDTEFNVTVQYTCNGFNCNNVYRNITFDSINCQVQPPKNNSLFIPSLTSLSTTTESIGLACSVAETINLNISVGNSIITLSDSASVTVELPGGLTEDESTCLLTGKFVNGTTCAVGQATEELNMLGIIFGYFVVILFFIYLGTHMKADPMENNNDSQNKNGDGDDMLGIRVFFFGIAFLQIIFLVFTMYANYISGDITNILFINFWVMLTIGVMALFISIFKLAKYVWTPDHFDEDGEENKW